MEHTRSTGYEYRIRRIRTVRQRSRPRWHTRHSQYRTRHGAPQHRRTERHLNNRRAKPRHGITECERLTRPDRHHRPTSRRTDSDDNRTCHLSPPASSTQRGFRIRRIRTRTRRSRERTTRILRRRRRQPIRHRRTCRDRH